MKLYNYMKIENQVCSLELATQLKELGVKQKSLFYWNTYEDGAEPEIKEGMDGLEYCSAFTVAELGEMLPKGIITHKKANGYVCEALGTLPYMCPAEFWSQNEADARAKMLIFLIKSKLI